MTLAWRILLLALLLNVLTVGSVQIVVHNAQQRWFETERRVFKQSVSESFDELARVYSPEAVRDATSNAAAALPRLPALGPDVSTFWENNENFLK